MSSRNRDDFSDRTKRLIASRAGWLCSKLGCRCPTIGSAKAGDGVINLGEAAHICAAAPGGPRYDPSMTPEQRKSATNGIWLCRLHAKAVDSDPAYTVEVLREWQVQAHRDSRNRVLSGHAREGRRPVGPPTDDSAAILRNAAVADLDSFRNSRRWPATSVALAADLDGHDQPVSTKALARLLTALDDLVLIAGPGMGKTTAVFQVAIEAVAVSTCCPIVIPLGDWATGPSTLLESVLKRDAFRDLSEDNIRAASAQARPILLLDGWNEIDRRARRRLKVQVDRLKWEIPELRLLVTTRREAFDVPIEGANASLRPLSESQQVDIARALQPEHGLPLLESAWQTPGVRDLVRTPLYLNALLALPEGSAFPTTREEALRAFVEANESDFLRADVVDQATDGQHNRYLEALAVTAMRAGNTTIIEGDAHRTVSQVASDLSQDGQIAHWPTPRHVLAALTSHHLLVRVNEPAGYSFQHQQFQEWYASSFVERLMLESTNDTGMRFQFQSEILNLRAWEEPILFACERLGQQGETAQNACAMSVLSAFEVDPMLAAEIVHRSPQAVWEQARADIVPLVGRWHSPDSVDRAVGFMIASGKEEFLDHVWPLIAHEDRQVRLTALRSARTFRSSVLGNAAARRLQALSPQLRKSILSELAYQCGADGLALVAQVAKSEPLADIRATIAEELEYRGASTHVIEVLQRADDETFDLLVEKQWLPRTLDETVVQRLSAATNRLSVRETWNYRRVAALVFGGSLDDPAELETAIAEMEIADSPQHWSVSLIYEASKRYPDSVASAVLHRLRTSRSLPSRAANLLAGTEFALEDESLLSLVLDENQNDNCRDAAASVLGPGAVGRLVDEFFNLNRLLKNTAARRDEILERRRSAIRRRIRATRIESLVSAATMCPEKADNARLAQLADLIAVHPNGNPGDDQPFSSSVSDSVAALVQAWGEIILASSTPERRHMASIATMASRAPSTNSLDVLRRLLDRELSSWREFRAQASATKYVPSTATNQARMFWIRRYAAAFLAVRSEQTTQLMSHYLRDVDFGVEAANVIAEQWRQENEPKRTGWSTSPDYSRVAEKRAARENHPERSCQEADAIFDAAETFLTRDATTAQIRHAVALGTAAATLPHGQRSQTIVALVELAEHRQLNALLNNLVLSGEPIEFQWVQPGISEALRLAKERTQLRAVAREIGVWLHLLPFTDHPSAALEVVHELRDHLRGTKWLEEMISVFASAPDEEAQTVFFQLAKSQVELYRSRLWIEEAFNFGTLSSRLTIVTLVAQGSLKPGDGVDEWWLINELAALLGSDTELRTEVYKRLSGSHSAPGTRLLARAVAENPDEPGFRALMDLEEATGHRFISFQTIERLVTKHVPDQHWTGSYAIVPVPAVRLRRFLLDLVTDGGSHDAAARHLSQIDSIRDEYGTPLNEPRHPHINSGKPWPLLTCT